MSFVHLNCKSDRSIGYGLIKPAALVDHYKSVGALAACITDSGHLNSAVQLNKACKKHGLLPVYGMQVNVVDDKAAKRQGSESLILIAKNRTGFYNLVKIATVGAMFFYYMPRVDLETLKKYSEGIIALTGDMRGVAAFAYFRGQLNGLERCYETYSEIYGDDFYFELQPVPTETQRVFNEALVDYQDQTPGCKLVVTGAPHYLREQDRDLHMMLIKARNFKNLQWEYPFKGPHHVRSREELVRELSELHGFEIGPGMSMWTALDNADLIVQQVEAFDLRDGVKVPNYIS